jgi:hypothetical protein
MGSTGQARRHACQQLCLCECSCVFVHVVFVCVVCWYVDCDQLCAVHGAETNWHSAGFRRLPWWSRTAAPQTAHAPVVRLSPALRLPLLPPRRSALPPSPPPESALPILGERCVSRGTKAAAPSSAHFSTSQSDLPPFKEPQAHATSHCQPVRGTRSGPGSSACTTAPALSPSSAICAVVTHPLPSHSSIRSPSRRRSVLMAWRLSSGGRRSMEPEAAVASGAGM